MVPTQRIFFKSNETIFSKSANLIKPRIAGAAVEPAPRPPLYHEQRHNANISDTSLRMLCRFELYTICMSSTEGTFKMLY